MGIKRYKGYTSRKEIDNDSINKRNRNINYICFFLILANLYLLPKYLKVSSEVDKTIENIPAIEADEDNNYSEDQTYKINFISQGLDIISGDYRDHITDFQLVEDQLIISYKDEDGMIIQDIDKIIGVSPILKIMDIELMQDSSVRIRMVRANE